MSLRLSYFPVLVPPDFDFAANTMERPRGNGTCPTNITFRDDFADDRHGFRHDAIDIFGARGLYIVATTFGEVVNSWVYNGQTLPGAGSSNGGGNFVRMIDLDGNVHYYAHFRDAPRVRSGEKIAAGQILGYLGNTGRARTTCPHLHYQVRGPARRNAGLGGRAINPYAELRRLFDAGR